MFWSFSTFLFSLDAGGLTRLWAGFVILSGACVMIAYYSFACSFVNRNGGLVVKLGYAAVSLILLPLVALGYIPQSVSVSGGAVDIQYGSLLYLIVGVSAPF